MKSITDAIESRISANSFDTNKQLSEKEIRHLIELATRAPSAFNLQNWKFIAVHNNEAKQRLLPLAYGQQKVVDASVTFIICGTLKEHLTLAEALKPSLDQGIIEEGVYNAWLGAANSMYAANEVLQRDEAIRSASLAAMTLMLAAIEMGFVSGPMIGFDPIGVAKEFNLNKTDVPVMLLPIGYEKGENWPQKPRKNVSDVLTFV